MVSSGQTAAIELGLAGVRAGPAFIAAASPRAGARRPLARLLRRLAEDPADAPRRQLRLRQESGRRAFGDQLRIVCLGAR